MCRLIAVHGLIQLTKEDLETLLSEEIGICKENVTLKVRRGELSLPEKFNVHIMLEPKSSNLETEV